jgi:hypothetical protein
MGSPAIAAALAASAAGSSAAASSDTWEKAGLTLLGTFVGASLAFASQLALWRKQERKSERLAAHRILFCLLQQSNTLVLIQKDWVEPHAASPIKFIEIPAASEIDGSKNLFDFSSFGFLLKLREGREVMYDLYLAQESYVETIRMINERSRMHREMLQPKMAEIRLGDGSPVQLSKLPELLGPLVYGSMVNATSQMLTLMQSTFHKLVSLKVAFRAYAVKYFGTADFTEFDFPESHGLGEKTA